MASVAHHNPPALSDAAPPTGAHIVWVPHHGVGNGIDAATWVPIRELDGRSALRLLDTLGAANIPTFACPVGAAPDDRWQLWVGAPHRSAAEQVLRST
jgi:hypothetical protein